MKTFSMIREDLKNIRYYYSRQKEMTNSARIVGESTILKTIEVYNAAICRRRLNFTNSMFVCT